MTAGCMDRDCPRIREILGAIIQDFPYVRDEVICELAGISHKTLQNWRARGTARSENVCRLIEHINNMPNDWDGELLEAGGCMG